jgi:hypothetical protein
VFAFFFAIGIAVVILPSVTSFRLGECPANRRLRCWGFLATKAALIILTVYGWSHCASYLIAPQLYPHLMLAGYLFGFRWMLIDQRNRCPVCLRLLSHPTRIGCTGHLLLEWYGTELVCSRGHGLLHVPGIPGSSYSAQRWLQLDCSWTGLF